MPVEREDWDTFPVSADVDRLPPPGTCLVVADLVEAGGSPTIR